MYKSMKSWAVMGIIIIVTVAVTVPIITKLPTTQHENIADNLMSKDTDNDGLSDYSENQLGTNPLIVDSDNDGLSDGQEVNTYGTNPLSPDTDKDGIWDGYEVDNMAQYGANPKRRDIFVEIDKMDAENIRWLNTAEKSKLVSVFETAPIQNPDGSSGVDLHLFEDNLFPYVNIAAVDDYIENYKNYGEGFYYCVLTGGGSMSGGLDFEVFAVENFGDITMDFLHELGHGLGLVNFFFVGTERHNVFDGIDSMKYSVEEYPSVMNYYKSTSYVDYSRSGVFNDWQYLQENGFRLHEYYYNL